MMTDSKNKDVIVRINGLEKTYKTSSETLTILKDLNMNVKRGTKCVIVGKRLDTASSGTVEIDGEMISSLGEDELTDYRQKFLGLIFQFHYLLKDFTALENVFLPSYMAGVSKKEAMEKAHALLCDVGLSDRTDHLPSELSGGERQRVAVARSLINDPELILADEPTGNLDPANAAVIGDLLFSMADKYKKTLILVTHDMNLAAKGDLRLFLKNGALTEDGEL